jgi:hypothetical protein
LRGAVVVDEHRAGLQQTRRSRSVIRPSEDAYLLIWVRAGTGG